MLKKTSNIRFLLVKNKRCRVKYKSQKWLENRTWSWQQCYGSRAFWHWSGSPDVDPFTFWYGSGSFLAYIFWIKYLPEDPDQHQCSGDLPTCSSWRHSSSRGRLEAERSGDGGEGSTRAGRPVLPKPNITPINQLTSPPCTQHNTNQSVNQYKPP